MATILSRFGVAPEPRSSKPRPGIPMSSTFAGAGVLGPTGAAATLSGSQRPPDHRARTTATTRAAPISPILVRLDVSRLHSARAMSAPCRARWANPASDLPVWR